jgi:hypothetical protein
MFLLINVALLKFSDSTVDDDNFRFVLVQQAELEFYSASSLK